MIRYLILAALLGSCLAQEAKPLPYWTRSRIALTAADLGAKAADWTYTERNARWLGFHERDPLARPFVRRPGTAAVFFGAAFALDTIASWQLHHRGHDRIAKWVTLGGIALNGTGAIQSQQEGHRTK